MASYTDTYGFESEDLDAIAKELARVLDMTPVPHFNEGLGGDYFAFGEDNKSGAQFSLYLNHSADVDGPIIQEEDFLELGAILLIEQEGEYIDYGPKLRRMDGYEAILLYRSKYPPDPGQPRVLFDLAKERSKTKR